MYPFQPDEALARARSGIVLDRISAGGLPLLALLLFLLVTHHGIGIWPDSTRYMSLSSQPWDAPLYPALLQLVAMPGIDIVSGAWGIGLVLAPLNAFLAWYLIRTASGSPAAAALGTAIIIIAPQTVTLHGLAMSEPLFLTTIYGTLIALASAATQIPCSKRRPCATLTVRSIIPCLPVFLPASIRSLRTLMRPISPLGYYQ